MGVGQISRAKLVVKALKNENVKYLFALCGGNIPFSMCARYATEGGKAAYDRWLGSGSRTRRNFEISWKTHQDSPPFQRSMGFIASDHPLCASIGSSALEMWISTLMAILHLAYTVPLLQLCECYGLVPAFQPQPR